MCRGQGEGPGIGDPTGDERCQCELELTVDELVENHHEMSASVPCFSGRRCRRTPCSSGRRV